MYLLTYTYISYLCFLFTCTIIGNAHSLPPLTLILKLNITLTSIWAKNQELELITDNWQVLFEH